jgi:hypothetical protein
VTIDTLAAFIAYGGIAIPHDDRPALIEALRFQQTMAYDDPERAERIAAAIHETECFLGMHKTPSPNPVTA